MKGLQAKKLNGLAENVFIHLLNSEAAALNGTASRIEMADFNELLKVLRCEKPSRSVLFEFFLNDRLYRLGCGNKYDESNTQYGIMCNMIHTS